MGHLTGLSLIQWLFLEHLTYWPYTGLPLGSEVKILPANVEDRGDLCLIPGLRRSASGGHGSPLQYSCLENPMDRGARGLFPGVAELDMTEVTERTHWPYPTHTYISEKSAMSLTFMVVSEGEIQETLNPQMPRVFYNGSVLKTLPDKCILRAVGCVKSCWTAFKCNTFKSVCTSVHCTGKKSLNVKNRNSY